MEDDSEVPDLHMRSISSSSIKRKEITSYTGQRDNSQELEAIIMGLIVHHLQRAQSERIVWLCEELGLDYELKTYQRNPKTYLSPSELASL